MSNETKEFFNVTYYIQNKNIDRVRWDDCISKASNGLMYAYSFYLDTMAANWDALVMNDYEAVMPLTWNRKFGVYYLYQPFLCASLGIFGNGLTKTIITTFLTSIPKHFRYWDFYLNTANPVSPANYKVQIRTNYVLQLNRPYSQLFAKYRYSYRGLLKKSIEQGLELKESINIEEIINLSRNTYAGVADVKEKDWNNFRKIFSELQDKRKVETYGVFKNNTLIASGVFFIFNDRSYYILAGNKAKGSAGGASHQVIDAFIKNHADTEMTLDFEGSNVAGIAFFFKGFGSEKEEYPGIKYNGLPLVLRRLKS